MNYSANTKRRRAPPPLKSRIRNFLGQARHRILNPSLAYAKTKKWLESMKGNQPIDWIDILVVLIFVLTFLIVSLETIGTLRELGLDVLPSFKSKPPRDFVKDFPEFCVEAGFQSPNYLRNNSEQLLQHTFDTRPTYFIRNYPKLVKTSYHTLDVTAITFLLSWGLMERQKKGVIDSEWWTFEEQKEVFCWLERRARPSKTPPANKSKVERAWRECEAAKRYDGVFAFLNDDWL